MKAPRRFVARLAPPTIDGVAELSERLDRWALDRGLSDGRRHDLLVAFDELASNVARYAEAASQLEVRAVVSPRRTVVLTVEDDGAPFDPLDRPAPATSAALADRQPGGLGIHLVRRLAKRVVYARSAERNRIEVELRR